MKYFSRLLCVSREGEGEKEEGREGEGAKVGGREGVREGMRMDICISGSHGHPSMSAVRFLPLLVLDRVPPCLGLC